jgi:transposase InsO family protein
MPKSISEKEKQRLVSLVKNGKSVAEVCEHASVSRSALYRWMSMFALRKRWAVQCEIDLNHVYKLERRLATLEEENAIFRKSGCGTKASNAEKVAAVKALKGQFTEHAICRTLDLSKATYYRMLEPRETWFSKKNEELRPAIKRIFEESKERFGGAKIAARLRAEGVIVSQKHASKLMKEMGLVCKASRLRTYNSTNRKGRFFPNRLLRKFTVDAPNLIWVSDITFVMVGNDMAAICAILDLYARRVVAYEISMSADTELVMKTFRNAFEQRKPSSKLLFHSDLGVQYTSFEFRKLLRESNVKQSFSNPGCPYDNAVSEGFFSIMKREELSHNWYSSIEELRSTVDEYIHFFNMQRPFRRLGNLTPEQYEKRYWAEHDKSKLE